MGWMPEKKPIAVFLQATDRPYHNRIHCMKCGMPFAEIWGDLVSVVDNTGIAIQARSARLTPMVQAVRLMCPRSTCKQIWVVHL